MGVISVSYAQESENKIPNWFKNPTSWWLEGSITDDDYIELIKNLLEDEIIVIEGYGKIINQTNISLPMELTVSTDKKLYIDG